MASNKRDRKVHERDMTEQQRRIRTAETYQKKREIRERKKRMKIFICVELLCILCVFSFLIGKNVGVKGEQKKQEHLQVTVKEPELGFMDKGNTDAIHRMEKENDKEQEIDNLKDVLGKALKEEILLVNKDNKLPEDYNVILKTLPDGVNRAAEEAYNPLCDMLAAGRKEGLAFEICSSYRDVKRQQELFDEDMNALIRAGYSYYEAYEEVAKETMPPGHSEHSTGLAFDIVALDYQILDERQEQTAENKWLREHCAEYGFILRYPKGKEEITDISYEPWHFRYVGVEVAKYIMDEGITLEEYLEEV